MMRGLRKVVCVLLSCWLLAVVAYAETGDKEITILTINDFHGALAENGKNPGAAKLAGYLRSEQEQHPDALLVSAGDMFQGSAESNLLHGKTVGDFMNAVDFDVMTLGNHEFDWGLRVLQERRQQAVFPYLAANVFVKSTQQRVDFVQPYQVVQRGGVRIAIIGLATPETAYKANPAIVGGLTFADPVAVVNELVPRLRHQGADVIIVVSHLDSWQNASGEITGDAARLALGVHDVDAIVSGHSHQVVAGRVNGVPIVQAGYNGRYVGKISLRYDPQTHRVRQSEPSVVVVADTDAAPAVDVQMLMAQAQQEILPVKNAILGNNQQELSHDRTQMLVTPLGQWVTDSMKQAAGVDIAFQNMGGLRTALPAGAVTMGKLYEVMPFDNTLVTMQLTGRQVRQVLAEGIGRKEIGTLQYAGLQLVYRLQRDGQGQLAEVLLADGQPLLDDTWYRVVTNDFMAAGGDGFTIFKQGRNIRETGIALRDVIANTIQQKGTLLVQPDRRWQVIEDAMTVWPAAS